MTIRLDHTIVPAKDKVASAEFFAEIFGLTVKPGYFAQVKVNDSLTMDFADEAEVWGGPGFDPSVYGSEPHDHTNGRLNTRRGGRGFYFEDPYGHLLEIMTVPETGS
jgi:catechol 2,3-dioxygenase-like lactoylglutathione lyase family enzyme